MADYTADQNILTLDAVSSPLTSTTRIPCQDPGDTNKLAYTDPTDLGVVMFDSAVFELLDTTDTTKTATVDLSNITTATTRTITIPDRDITLGEVSSDTTPTLGGPLDADGNDITNIANLTTTSNVGIGESSPDYTLDVNGTIGFTPGVSVVPIDNGDVVFEFTNNTTITIRAKGTDGTVRSGTITLS